VKRTLAHACLVSLLCLCTARLAGAEDEQTQRALFERARAHLKNEQWDKARELFEKLWNDRNTYDVALQLGQAEYHLGQYRNAAEHLAYGLATLPPREKLETAERSRQILALCRREVGTLDLRVKNKGAEILVDQKVVGITPLLTELYVEPGAHRFEVRLAAHQSVTWTLQFTADQTQWKEVQLVALVPPSNDREQPASKGRRPSTPPPRQADDAAHRASYVPVVAGGIVTAAGLTAGIVLQLARNSRKAEANDIQSRIGANGCGTPSAAAQGDCERLVTLGADYDSFGRLELLSFLFGGAALLGTGTYFFVARPDRAEPNTASWHGPLRINASRTLRETRCDITLDF
jgi:hypothetical protein